MLQTAVAVSAAAAVIYAATRGPANLTYVRSNRTNKDYLVQDLPDKQEACERMASIQEKLHKLMKRYKEDPATAAEPRIQTMIERFHPENMCESDMRDSTTSYSENKGDRIVVCLRQKTQGYPLVEENTVMFVVLHEISHLMTFSIGHTPEFWANFRRLLNDAIGVGIYQNVNYSHTPVPYCGIQITDNPL
jgi:predicted metal-dependent hydrolase